MRNLYVFKKLSLLKKNCFACIDVVLIVKEEYCLRFVSKLKYGFKCWPGQKFGMFNANLFSNIYLLKMILCIEIDLIRKQVLSLQLGAL